VRDPRQQAKSRRRWPRHRAGNDAHVTPLGWKHLSLTGDYAWDIEGQPTLGELRPLKTRASLLVA
jgi:hypothetical protein